MQPFSILQELKKYADQLRKQPGPTVADFADKVDEYLIPHSPAEAAMMLATGPGGRAAKVGMGGLAAATYSPDTIAMPPEYVALLDMLRLYANR